MRKFLFAALLFATAVSAQSTWIVDSMGGPGVHFTDLGSAVTSAMPGDRIEVRQGAPAGAYLGFSTNKGLTIVGVGGGIQLSLNQRIEVSAIPANETFRMVGFTVVRGQSLDVRITGCAGEVHLESLFALEPGFFLPAIPSIAIRDCARVTMRQVETFGSPAVQIDNSTVTMSKCRFGLSVIGLGPGTGVVATDSNVRIGEPTFRTGLALPAIVATRCDLRIGGSTAAVIAAGDPAWGIVGTPIVTTLGTLRIDPNVQLLASPVTAPPITGTAVVSFEPQPAVWTGTGFLGGVLAVDASAPAGSAVVAMLGLPAPAFATPLGDLFLQLSPVAAVLAGTTGGNGVLHGSLAVPLSLPRGLAFAVQSASALPAGLRLGIPCTFVTH